MVGVWAEALAARGLRCVALSAVLCAVRAALLCVAVRCALCCALCYGCALCYTTLEMCGAAALWAMSAVWH